MRGLSATELLDVWAQGHAQPPPGRALLLLAAACPEFEPAALARLTVGQRDGLLLALYEQTFGPRVTGVAVCPRCAAEVELAFDAADIRVGGPPPEDGPPPTQTLIVEGYEIVFRAPDSNDLLALAADEAAARETLLARCLVSVAAVDPPNLAPEVELPGPAPLSAGTQAAIAAAVDAALAEMDPQAEVELNLACPACDQQWQALFDIVAFFWDELTAWAHRMLRQVHVLASAYGWREAEILALPAWRRQYYLEMVGG
ncbi:MAG: hypothetical protein BWY52_01495 [Chloroflexi bacterium ADurb.Bin325]|nr:MAG: hypothetical protein BWY52_01495 [Chloroflexi bacterium ADurb.Bin325]